MNYHIIPVTVFAQNCSVIWCVKTKKAALIDPGGDAEKIKYEVNKLNLTINKILITHGHLDHVGAASELSIYYKVPIIGPHIADKFWLDSLSKQSEMFGLNIYSKLISNHWLSEHDQIRIGKNYLEVLLCPGHTPGHVVFFDKISRLLISGDVIFNGSIGRFDFPKGSYRELLKSIYNKLLPLGDDVTIIPGHGNISTIGHERINNPFLKNN